MNDRRRPALIGLGCATPALEWTQREACERLAAAWRLDRRSLDLWRRIVEGSGIDVRHGVLPPDELIALRTAARMRLYEEHAPALAADAARRALEAADLPPHEITDLFIVSCTGFSAPGVDVALVDRLGLSGSVRRTTIGYMGCFGAITGLRAACGACAAAESAEGAALVVCVELCSVHLPPRPGPQQLVSAALFSDGAAAAVVVKRHREGKCLGPFSIDIGRSRLLAGADRNAMTWRITDHGFVMTLDPAVPASLRAAVRADPALCRQQGSDRLLLAHPGGPKILDAIEDGAGLRRGALSESREVLRRFGNMSSPTVLFVLEEAMRRQPMAIANADLVAFGPGLTIETLSLSGRSGGATGCQGLPRGQDASRIVVGAD